MAVADLATLTAPIAGDEPCGPDLDLAGDLDYMNFMARAEGLLPASFFGPDGRPFDRGSINFEAEIEALKPFLEQTRDLRLMTLLAKLLVLNRDLEGFETTVNAIGVLLRDYWEAVHPRGEDGDYTIRMAALETLDDMPPVVMPLQYLPLVRHKRMGPLTYRGQMIASGEVKAREGEDSLDANAYDKALMEVELDDLVAVRDRFGGLQTALGTIRGTFGEHAGAEQSPNLDKLSGLVVKIRGLLDGVVRKRDPSAALPVEAAEGADGASEPGSATAPALPNLAFKSSAKAGEALAATALYFDRLEPSNPALLLIRQAQLLIGKSFIDAMRMLVPSFVDQATFNIGRDQMFELPLERLAELTPTEEAFPQADGEESGTEAEADDVAAAEGEAHAAPSNGAGAPLVIATRAQAVAALTQIAGYFQTAEPSSPVPFLLERARLQADRDFLSLLKEILPDETLKTREG